ncbi:putative sulfate exporter family transporter [Hymenobacter lutimineralis]|uniref:Putative sulfate exporter family transporter n=1 Tax=Hymenobacter lutimineralis TaxID=2606448 RepID=A0A5D6VGP6_9BACT|nr:putative sulfate exporter family transporter [Hymenobacter lutimineralis]TYZ14282.1 putative sulfate exporter family transporter [Hymenobacter lutimineralis]
MSTAVKTAPVKTSFTLHEDWVVVVLGALLIGLSLSGLPFAVPVFNWDTAADLTGKVLSPANLLLILTQFGYLAAVAAVGAWLTNRPLQQYALGFPTVYLLTLVALVAAGSKTARNLGLEAVIFSLLAGLLIGNLFRLPDWLRTTLTTELFVKIGLVLLGTNVIFTDILKAGSLGLVQALVVVLSVWYFAFWLCRKLKVDEELTMMIASAVSICGVSAAIATSGAIKGDGKKLSYVISLVLITAIPMMLLMPYAAHWLGLSQEVTGAWLGGSIDTTGAVVASGTLVGEEALKISTIVKFSQNVLLGAAAFAISMYWTYTSHPNAAEPDTKPTLGVIWERFPKFVLGFVAASLLFSFVLSPETTEAVKGGLKSAQGLWFALAFTSIGLETNFKDLFKHENKKPLYAFLLAQTFNIFITLLIASLLFR